MLTVPANLVPQLRSGLFGEWGFAAEDISHHALQFGSKAPDDGSEAPDDVYRKPLETFDVGRALLDAVGWRTTSSQADVSIDLSRHRLYPRLVTGALANEQFALVERLAEMPKTTIEEVRQAVRAQIEALDEFIAVIEGLRLADGVSASYDDMGVA